MIYAKFVFFRIIVIAVSINEITVSKVQGIIGGTLAEQYDFKYMVSLRRGNRIVCGGGLLSSRHVIAAAHCLFDTTDNYFAYRRLLVVAATTNAYYPSARAIVSEVEKIFIPKAYKHSDSSLYDTAYSVVQDIAIFKLRLAFHVQQNYGLKRLRLPDDNVLIENKTLVIGGFGYNQIQYEKDLYSPDFELFRRGWSDGKLRYANVTILPYNECGYLRNLFIEGTAFCARMEQTDLRIPEGTCIGDGGGPLVYDNNKVIGILVAASMACNEKATPAIYSNISYHLGFINDALLDRVTPDMIIYTWAGAHNLVRHPSTRPECN